MMIEVRRAQAEDYAARKAAEARLSASQQRERARCGSQSHPLARRTAESRRVGAGMAGGALLTRSCPKGWPATPNPQTGTRVRGAYRAYGAGYGGSGLHLRGMRSCGRCTGVVGVPRWAEQLSRVCWYVRVRSPVSEPEVPRCGAWRVGMVWGASRAIAG